MAKKGEPLQPEDKKKLNIENLRKLGSIFSYLLPYKGTFIAGLACLVVSTFSVLAFPYVASLLVNVANGQAVELPEAFGKSVGESYQPNFTINQLALVLLGILIIQAVFSFLRVYLFSQVSERSMANIRKSLYKKFVVLPMTFYDSRRTGELLSRITSDVSMLQDTFSTTLAEFVRQTLTLTAGTFIIFYFTPDLALFMLATFPVLIIVAMFFGNFIRKLSKKTQDELATANVIVEETLQSINIVKSFTSEVYELLRYKKAQDNVVKIALRAAKYRGAFISFIIAVLFGGIVAIIWRGAILVQEGEMLVSDLFSFLFYTFLIGGSIAGLGDLIGQIQKAIGASERVLEITGMQGEMEVEKESPSLHLEGDIEYKNAHFRYPTRADISVLNGVNFRIKSGEKIALVGHSGAGKSTIIQLLMRFYTLQDGQILVDGRDIQQYDLHAYRSNIGIVPQEIILFGGTIRENIAYGKHTATEEEIREAARKANALQFIENFPEGLDTVVGERGVKLSGGQRQRIAIARAILKDPKILILDEATSSLDAESESLVQEALDELMIGRTTIIIAHRLATIRKVDKIYVINQGQIAESGSHEELLQHESGTYANLIKLQLQEE